MKKVFEYIATLLLLLAVGTSCEEGNDNWKVITAVPTGLYITGDATIYSAAATSSQLTTPAFDNAPEGTNIVGIYTWLKSSGSFTMLEVDSEGNEINYGSGESVATTPAPTYRLTVGGSPLPNSCKNVSTSLKVNKAGLFSVGLVKFMTTDICGRLFSPVFLSIHCSL